MSQVERIWWWARLHPWGALYILIVTALTVVTMLEFLLTDSRLSSSVNAVEFVVLILVVSFGFWLLIGCVWNLAIGPGINAALTGRQLK